MSTGNNDNDSDSIPNDICANCGKVGKNKLENICKRCESIEYPYSNGDVQFYEAFEEGTNISHDTCRGDMYQLKTNQPLDENQFILDTFDAETFSDQAWKLFGRYISNNEHLEKLDLDSCRLADNEMAFLFSELVTSSSLKQISMSDNEM